MRPVRAVLFDFAGTLLVPEPREQWVAAACPELLPGEVAELAEALERAGRAGGPAPVAMPERWTEDYARRDLSADRHRALYEGLMAGVTGPGAERTRRLYDRGTGPDGYVVYPDSLPVLQALRDRGIPVAVVSNVGFDLRAVFAGHGLDAYITAFALSYEVGVMKPGPALFSAACEALGAAPEDTLMVGDDPRADAGACDLGIRTLLLPYSPAGADHGLRAVLALVDAGELEPRPLRPAGGAG